jgi:peptide/nickel transport system permease protein
MRHVLALDLGCSLINRQAVTVLLRSRLPATLLLAGSSLLLSLSIAVPAGMIAALRKDTWLDTGFRLLALFGVSVPGFWLGYILIIIFALKFKVLPVSGYGSPG